MTVCDLSLVIINYHIPPGGLPARLPSTIILGIVVFVSSLLNFRNDFCASKFT